jgi:diaminohydroxyphosphoribosylaminopyrimidine deaminase/5-amino-6-(5-phosphoribosylamino)uracil reductase
LNISKQNPIFKDGIPTVILNQHKEDTLDHVRYIKVQDTRDVKAILQILFDLGIYSVLVEGGSEVHQSFIQTNQWHKACVITNSQMLREGVKAPALTGHLQQSYMLGKDRIQIIKNNSHYE